MKALQTSETSETICPQIQRHNLPAVSNAPRCLAHKRALVQRMLGTQMTVLLVVCGQRMTNNSEEGRRDEDLAQKIILLRTILQDLGRMAKLT